MGSLVIYKYRPIFLVFAPPIIVGANMRFYPTQSIVIRPKHHDLVRFIKGAAGLIKLG